MDDNKATGTELERNAAARCSLEGAELDERLGEIGRLTGRALVERQDQAGSTVLWFDRAAAAEVRDLVRRERQCCAHLECVVEESDERVRVTIRSRSDVGPGGVEPPSDGL